MAANKYAKTDFLKIAHERRTTYEFDSRPIKPGDLAKILEAARWAPSAGNLQPWRFIVVRDKKAITALVDSAYYGAFHSDPALAIAITLPIEGTPGCGTCSMPLFNDAELAAQQDNLGAGMAALNMVYMAQSLGIGSCLLTSNREKTGNGLKLAKARYAAIVIGFGYAKKGAYSKPREREKIGEMASYASVVKKRRG